MEFKKVINKAKKHFGVSSITASVEDVKKELLFYISIDQNKTKTDLVNLIILSLTIDGKAINRKMISQAMEDMVNDGIICQKKYRWHLTPKGYKNSPYVS